MSTSEEQISFPRQTARTQRFTLGAPRSISVSADGQRVVFLRSSGGRDASTALWLLDVATGAERLVAEAAGLLGRDDGELSAEERARRERARETAGGITSYSLDSDGTRATFALAGRLFGADLVVGSCTELAAQGPVFDPRLSPDGLAVAYCSSGSLRLSSGDGDRDLVSEDGVTWGLAEFVAAEEMGRFRGHWWSPESDRLLVARVDEAPVQVWWASDPANPDRAPSEQRYPAAGTPNAEVTLWLLSLDGVRTEVRWDREGYEYVAGVAWSTRGGLVVLVQSRDQRSLQWRSVDTQSGATSVRQQAADDHWLELVEGTPAFTDSGRLISVLPHLGANRLHVDGAPVTPDGLQVSAVLSLDGESVLLSGTEEPTESHVYLWDGASTRRLTPEQGVHTARGGGGTVAITTATLAGPGSSTTVLKDGGRVGAIASYAEQPVLAAAPRLLNAGERQLRSALLLPTGWVEGSGRLPVLLDPYGGPHAQRVLAAHNAFLASQWFADQGFAVLVSDGRGTPARGPDWERSIHGRWGDAVLDDQVHALHAAAAAHPDLDLERVAIRGWSYGGYLAALAVLRRPEVFHCAIAGAPVTDWTLYDTHYTERYLGTDPHGRDAARYAEESLLTDAPSLRRPLMLIHGLADDNVVAAHTLRLSSALLAAGRPHEVLPLSGVTHMTPQEEVAENLLLLQIDFLRRCLGA
ncbi:MAG: dipeptidyl-peptidase 4 [Frankiales bacterium]|nr:dipeptidyl-peptidase 4 [Frankiales bacterium]